ncbi:unnamed protein product [Blepharisma stoltei]|uniref:Uncharacterized protein n=1 Tax=Blepharisma stoltei TaxID=1481888 RepID=A0AAU9IVW6_9CILI|nr:unnamed protein product [Blepharisma stoltei]
MQNPQSRYLSFIISLDDRYKPLPLIAQSNRVNRRELPNLIHNYNLTFKEFNVHLQIHIRFIMDINFKIMRRLYCAL